MINRERRKPDSRQTERRTISTRRDENTAGTNQGLRRQRDAGEAAGENLPQSQKTESRTGMQNKTGSPDIWIMRFVFWAAVFIKAVTQGEQMALPGYNF